MRKLGWWLIGGLVCLVALIVAAPWLGTSLARWYTQSRPGPRLLKALPEPVGYIGGSNQLYPGASEEEAGRSYQVSGKAAPVIAFFKKELEPHGWSFEQERTSRSDSSAGSLQDTIMLFSSPRNPGKCLDVVVETRVNEQGIQLGDKVTVRMWVREGEGGCDWR